MTKNDILGYAKDCGAESAANLMLLLGYSGFEGSIAEYEALYAELEARASEEQPGGAV